MKNAHERFGTLEYTKRMKDTTTHIRLRLDRFIGEIEGERNSKAHLISVLGGDSDVGAIGAAINEQSSFTVQGPGIEPVSAGTRRRRAVLSRNHHYCWPQAHPPLGRNLGGISKDAAGSRPGRQTHGAVR